MTTNALPQSPWLVTLPVIAAYAGGGMDIETVNQALLSGELEGRQRVPGGKWYSKAEWVDAWIDGFGRRAS